MYRVGSLEILPIFFGLKVIICHWSDDTDDTCYPKDVGRILRMCSSNGKKIA